MTRGMTWQFKASQKHRPMRFCAQEIAGGRNCDLYLSHCIELSFTSWRDGTLNETKHKQRGHIISGHWLSGQSCKHSFVPRIPKHQATPFLIPCNERTRSEFHVPSSLQASLMTNQVDSNAPKKAKKSRKRALSTADTTAAEKGTKATKRAKAVCTT